MVSHLPTGITVITAVGQDGKPIGMTCDSFTSVSLAPSLVLFCVNRRSTAWPRLREAGGFCANILASHHGELSTRFAARRGEDRFAGLEWTVGPCGPELTDAVGCTIETQYSARVRAVRR
ncbi:flavin reductase family protein [Streptomyces sp. NPDC058632]|uniref:flavin reductase family protein n=1 Tax=unclassified Streptomyces TaxID=2593676 RepID=UPI0036616FF7